MLLLILTAMPIPVDLDTINAERARALHGRLALVRFTNAGLVITYRGQTVMTAPTLADGVERVARLRGDRANVRDGARVEVVGVLKVIDHKVTVAGSDVVSQWTEIRVQE